MGEYGRWVLFAEDVASIWTEERRALEGSDAPAVSVELVWDYLRWSKPTPEGVKSPHRYETHPMPYPRESPARNFALWSGDQVEDLREWWHDRGKNAKRAAGRVERRKAEWAQDRRGVTARAR